MNPTEPINKPIPAFFTHIEEIEDVEHKFHFRKPTLSELDRFTSKLSKNAVTTALALCEGCGLESSKNAWLMLVSEKPGTATHVANELSRLLGFRQA
jgi:hypothetical protein